MRSVSPATRNQSVACVSHVWSTQNSLVNMGRSSCRTSTRAMSCEYYKLAFIGNVLILLFVIARGEKSLGEKEVKGIQEKQQFQIIVPESRASEKSIDPRRRNFIDGKHFGRSYGSVNDNRPGAGEVADEEKTIKDFDWLSSLSKIAKVKSANETYWNSRVAGSGIGLKFEKKISVSKDQEATNDTRSEEVIKNDDKIQETNDTERSKVEFKPKKFHCHPIKDIYIPKVEKKIPAYICKLGERAFILSSERFLQDYRNHMDVTVDESTFQQLVPNSMALRSPGADVISATLVLKPGEDNYGIRKSRRNP